MPRAAVVLLSDEEGRRLVRKHCRRAKMPVGDLERLVEELMRSTGGERRRAFFAACDDVFDAAEDELEF